MAKKHPTKKSPVKDKTSWWAAPSRNFEFGLVLLALILRLIYLLQVRDNPHFYQPTMDPEFHLRWAQSILAGGFWGSEVFFRAPLYPYLLALFHVVSGGDLFYVRLLQHGLGVVAVWGLYRLGRATISEPAGKIAGILAACYAPLIYFEDELLLDFLLVGFTVLLFYGLLQCSRLRQTRWLWVTGLTIGLFAITRPTILVCVPIFVWWVWKEAPVESATAGRLRRVTLILAGILIPILPVTVRNAVVGNDFVLISSQGGINFFIGNNAEADGLSAAMPEPWGHTWQLADVRAYADKQAGRSLKPSELSDFWLGRAIDWWGNDPQAALQLTGKKAILLLTNREVSNNQNIDYFWRNYAPIVSFLPLSFGIVAAFGLVGLFVSIRRNRLVGLMLVFLGIYGLTVVAFFVPGRFRLPLIPILLLGCGGFIDMATTSLRRKVFKWIGLAAIPLAVILVISFGSWYQTAPQTDAQALYQQGNAALREQNYTEAIRLFKETLAAHPGYPEAHLNLGVAYFHKRMVRDAEEQFQQELEVNPRSAKAYANLAGLKDVQGDPVNAEKYALKARQYDPENAAAILTLCNVYGQMHKYDQAIALMDEAPEWIVNSPAGLNALGGAYLNKGQYDKAEKYLLVLAEGRARRDPKDFRVEQRTFTNDLGYANITTLEARANYNLGWSWARRGDVPKSIEFFSKAIELDSKFHEALANIGAAYISLKRPDTALVVFERALKLQPNNAGYLHNVGIAKLELGDTTGAIAEFQRALKIDPNFGPSGRKLKALGMAP